MIVCCHSPWHKSRAGLQEHYDGVDFVFNQYVEGADMVVDIKDTRSELSRRYPPERRAWVHLEPIRRTRYFAGFESYYAGGVLSWHSGLEALPQFRPYRQGGLGGSARDNDADKVFGVSGHISGKQLDGMDGYRLRRMVLARQQDIAIPSMVYNFQGAWQGVAHDYPRESTDEAMDHMFYLAVENCRERHYFSEKIIRAFANFSVPLYFGDPCIGEVFDTRGIIPVDGENWLETINALTPADYFERADAMRINYYRSRRYWGKLDRIAALLKTLLPATTPPGDASFGRAVVVPVAGVGLEAAGEGYRFHDEDGATLAECNGTAAYLYSLADGDRDVNAMADIVAREFELGDADAPRGEILSTFRHLAGRGVVEYGQADAPGLVPRPVDGCSLVEIEDGYAVQGPAGRAPLNPPAAMVFSLCDGETDVSGIARRIEEGLEQVPAGGIAGDVYRTVLRLADRGLLAFDELRGRGGPLPGAVPGSGRRRPRILVVLTRYPQLSETYIKTELEVLEADYDVRVVTFGDSNLRYANHLPYTVVKVRGNTMHEEIDDEHGDLWQAIESFRPDILHTHYLHNVPIVGEMAERAGIPFTVRAHSYDVMARNFRHHVGDGRPSPGASVHKTVSWVNREECLGVLTFPYTLPAFREAGVREEKLVSCYPVVNFSAFYDRGDNGRGMLNVEPCLPKKAVTDFIDVARVMPGHRFSLYGMGHQLAKVTAYNESLGSPAVMCPTVEPEEMPAVYKQHHWLIYTASFKNGNVGWPVAVFEAQAAGLGVCVANVHPHVVDQLGGAGFVYDSVEDIPGIVAQPYPEEMRELGFDNARKSDVYRHIHLLTDLWAPVFAASAPAPTR